MTENKKRKNIVLDEEYINTKKENEKKEYKIKLLEKALQYATGERSNLQSRAQNKRIFSKAYTVVEELGERREKKHGYYMDYSKEFDIEGEKKEFKIHGDSHSSILSIFYDGKEVFHKDRNRIKTFIEGEWINILEELYEMKVKPIKINKKIENLMESIKDYEKNFGFNPIDLLPDK